MKEYKCMDCLTGFEAEYKEDCPSCGDDSDVIEVSAHTDKLSVEKLQEQLNTLEMALTEISEIINDDIHECDYSCDNDCEMDGSLNMYSVENVQSIIDSALAEIGGNDE